MDVFWQRKATGRAVIVAILVRRLFNGSANQNSWINCNNDLELDLDILENKIKYKVFLCQMNIFTYVDAKAPLESL